MTKNSLYKNSSMFQTNVGQGFFFSFSPNFFSEVVMFFELSERVPESAVIHWFGLDVL